MKLTTKNLGRAIFEAVCGRRWLALDGFEVFGQGLDLSGGGSSKALAPDRHLPAAVSDGVLLSVDPIHYLLGGEAAVFL